MSVCSCLFTMSSLYGSKQLFRLLSFFGIFSMLRVANCSIRLRKALKNQKRVEVFKVHAWYESFS